VATPTTSAPHRPEPPAPPPAPSAEPPAPDAAAETAEALLGKALSARKDGQRDRARAYYDEIAARFAGTAEAAIATVACARMELDAGRAEEALVLFDRYLAGPDHTLEEEALAGKARACEHLQRSDAEEQAWRRLLDRFPRSVHAQRAEQRLSEIAP
jgi:TolA-binding protein